jgi:uncharacterized membrane protein YfcA
MAPWLSGWPIISDPHFYAWAVPAALILGISKSGFASGVGSITTPLVAMAVAVPQAAAIMLPLLALSDLLGMSALRHGADWRLLRLLMPTALLGIVAGWASFGLLDSHLVAGVVGVATLLFLAQQWLLPLRADRPPPGPWITGLLCALSGYTSFVAHAGAPPVAAAMLPRRMTPAAYAGTWAVLFTAMNASKWVPYAMLGLLDLRNLGTSVVLMPVAALGVWLGLWASRRISSRWFFRLVQLGMLLTGLKLLFDAWG